MAWWIAQTKVLHFVDGVHVVKDSMIEMPPLFLATQDMCKVFNIDHRMELYVDEATAEEIIAIPKSFNVDAQVIGRVEEGSKELTIRSEFGEFVY